MSLWSLAVRRWASVSSDSLTGMTIDQCFPTGHARRSDVHRIGSSRCCLNIPPRIQLDLYTDDQLTRLQDMLDLTPGNLITHLRKLEDAGYLTSETTGMGRGSRTSITLTRDDRVALANYTKALRDLLGEL
jgi:hypothetical protein